MLIPSFTASVLSRVHGGGPRAHGSRVARDPPTRLGTAIDTPPAATRRAMLEGIAAHTIVAGAYTDGRGGICPMLAAHRHGGRTSFVSFGRAWDAFARTETGPARLATRVARPHRAARPLARRGGGPPGRRH